MAGDTNRKGTLKVLAKQLGLSVTTVSRALGGYSDVAESTRARVLQAASQAAYVPNSAARMLVSGRSGFVGFLLPLRETATLDPFLGEYITGLSEGLSARGRDLFMATVPAQQTELEVLKHVVESGRADGMVLTRVAEHDERIDFLMERGVPFVAHGRTLKNPNNYSWIDTDGSHAFAETFQWLYELGHRSFGLLSITESMSFRGHRENGLRRAMTEQGDPGVSLVTKRVPRFDLGARRQAVNELLGAEQRPSAILALTDELGLCVLEQAELRGIRVPEQLSIVGFDNIPAASYSQPGLTTFDQAIRDTARRMAEVLLDSLDGQSEAIQTLITPSLVKRGSHAPAPPASCDSTGRVLAGNAIRPLPAVDADSKSLCDNTDSQT